MNMKQYDFIECHLQSLCDAYCEMIDANDVANNEQFLSFFNHTFDRLFHDDVQYVERAKRIIETTQRKMNEQMKKIASIVARFAFDERRDENVIIDIKRVCDDEHVSYDDVMMFIDRIYDRSFIENNDDD